MKRRLLRVVSMLKIEYKCLMHNIHWGWGETHGIKWDEIWFRHNIDKASAVFPPINTRMEKLGFTSATLLYSGIYSHSF